jgi:hypothetical protein
MISPLLYVSNARHSDFPQLFRLVCWGCTVPRAAN